VYHLLFYLFLRANSIQSARQKNSKILEQNAPQYGYNVLTAVKSTFAGFLTPIIIDSKHIIRCQEHEIPKTFKIFLCASSEKISPNTVPNT
jgi:hypothetical protein